MGRGMYTLITFTKPVLILHSIDGTGKAEGKRGGYFIFMHAVTIVGEGGGKKERGERITGEWYVVVYVCAPTPRPQHTGYRLCEYYFCISQRCTINSDRQAVFGML